MPAAVLLLKPPAWIRRVPGEANHWVLDTDAVIPATLEILRVVQPTQYWAEIAYLIVKRAAIKALGPRAGRLRFSKSTRWALLSLPAHPGMELVGAREDAHIAKLQRDCACHKARQDWQRYWWAADELAGV